MKVIRKPYEVISWFEEDGTIHPIKIKLKNETDETTVIKIERIQKRERSKMASCKVVTIVCEATFPDKIRRIFELRYFQGSCTWQLFKI